MSSNTLNHKISKSYLLKFAMPTILSMILMSVYGMVDGIFVSRLVGTNALSAVNVSMPFILIGVALSTMFGTGGNAICARLLGEGKAQKARGLFSFFVLAFAGLLILFTVFGIVFMKPLLRVFGASDVLMEDCMTYSFWNLILTPLSYAGLMFQPFHITNGKAKLGLLLSVAGGITNVVLDYVFIAVLGMGIAGAAIATSIGYSLSTIMGIYMFWKRRDLAMYFVKPILDFVSLRKCCSNGASEMVNNISVSLVTILINNVMIRLAGEDGVAAVTIILYAQDLFGAILIGYSIGVSPLISYNYGRGDKERLEKIFRNSMITIGIVATTTWAVSILCRRMLVGFFAGGNANVMKMATHGFAIYATSFLFSGFSIYTSGMFTALSNGKISALISFLRSFLFVTCGILLMSWLWGLEGVWMAVPLAEILGFVVSVTCIIKYKK